MLTNTHSINPVIQHRYGAQFAHHSKIAAGAIWYNANVWQREVFVEPANGLRRDVPVFYAKSIDERI
jgi:hypothetical protein